MIRRRLNIPALVALLWIQVPAIALRAGLPGFPAAPAGVARSADPWVQKIDLFTSGQGGYELYRIPGLVFTARGSLLAFCDARKSEKLGDWSNIDLSMRRSTDGGLTWSPQNQVVDIKFLAGNGYTLAQNPVAAAQGYGAPGTMPLNNQMPVVDRETGAVHFLFCANYNRCFHERSDDDGATYGPPVEITSVLEQFRSEYPWKVFGTGPNHGIQLKSGRLLVPIWMSRSGGDTAHLPDVVATIYSDDHGATWHRGAIAALESDGLVINPSETVAVELEAGGVMLSMRNQSLQHRRAITYSADGISAWSRPELVDDLAEPQCMAGIDRLTFASKEGKSRLVFSFCDNCTDPVPFKDLYKHSQHMLKRKNLTIALSYDEGRTWPVRRTVEPEWAGYSDIGVAPDGVIYCLYESGSLAGNGAPNKNTHLTLVRCNLAWVSRGQDHL